MNRDTSKFIKNVFSCNIKCKDCNEISSFKAVIINQDGFPSKLELVSRCTHCNTHNVIEHDMVSRDHGVEITCHFFKDDLNRFIYINANAEIKLFDSKEIVYESISTETYVDTVETMLTRIRDSKEREFESGGMNLDSEIALNKDISILNKFIETGEFNMTIFDESGFSRVCPNGLTLKQIENKGIEELNEERVNYNRIEKQE